MKIYHNPRCRKSRETLELIKSKGIDPEVIEYLKSPLTKEEIKSILEKLGLNAKDIIRKNESIFKEEFKGKVETEDEILKMLVENPKLIERPIVIENNEAIIGRPPENVLKLIK